jgi:hypothetical protein
MDVADSNQPPVITSYDVQGSASTAGGEVVTVTGSNLSVITGMSIGPYAAGFVIDSDTQVRFTAPAYDPTIWSEPATAKVWAMINSLTSESDQFPEWTWGGQTRAELQAAHPHAADPAQPQGPGDINQPPVITSYDVQGSASTAGGEVVTVTGSNLSVMTGIGIGPYAAGFVIDSDTQVRFTAPAYDPAIWSEPASAKVMATIHSLTSETDQFPEWTWGGQTRAELQAAHPHAADPAQPQGPGDINQPPVITSYDVQGSASAAGGEVVTVTGSNLSVMTGIGIGPYAAGFVIDSDTQVRFTAPAYDPAIWSEPASAKVMATIHSLTSETDQFPEWTWGGQTRAELQAAHPHAADPAQTQGPGDQNQPPVITGYDVQGSSSTSGGETVTVTGSNLSVVNSVGVGPYAAQFVIDSDTQLRFTAPAYDPSIRSDPATAKVSAGNNSLMSDSDQFPEWTWGGQTRAELQAAQTN